MNSDKLPVDFDGIFRFTNFTDEEFKARWDNVEYTFPASSTTPLIIPNATPEQVQSIRKKFAKELAIQEWYRTDKFKRMDDHTPGGRPALYTESDIAPFVQRCLEPLPIAQAKIQVLPKQDETKFRKDNRGRNVTRILEKDESLLSGASGAIE